MSYANEQALATRLISAKGASVAFSRTVLTYNPATGETTQAVTAAASTAVAKVPSGANVERIKALDLINLQTVVLIVAGAALGQFQPKPNDLVTWGGTAYTVRDVSLLAPSANEAILYNVIAAR